MGLARGVAGVVVSAGIFVGGAFAINESFDSYNQAKTYEACRDFKGEVLPAECPNPAFVDSQRSSESFRYGLFAFIGGAAVITGAGVLYAGVDEIFTEDQPSSKN
jgi:hypothetical protein